MLKKTVCGVVQFIKYRVTGKALKRKRQGEGLLYPVTEPKKKRLTSVHNQRQALCM